jgi:hypothetical protein
MICSFSPCGQLYYCCPVPYCILILVFMANEMRVILLPYKLILNGSMVVRR